MYIGLQRNIILRKREEILAKQYGKEYVQSLSAKQKKQLYLYKTLDPYQIERKKHKTSSANKGIVDYRSGSYAERTQKYTGAKTLYLTPKKSSPREIRQIGTIPVSESFLRRTKEITPDIEKIRQQEAREQTIAERKQSFLAIEKERQREMKLYKSPQAQEVFKKQERKEHPILSRYYRLEESYKRLLMKGSSKPFIVTKLEGGKLKPFVIKPSIKETYIKAEKIGGKFLGGVVKGYLKDIEQNPLKHTGLFIVSAGLPPVSKGLGYIGTKLPKIAKVARPIGKIAHYGLPSAYFGIRGYEVYSAKGLFKKGEVVGKTGAEVTSVVIGGKFGKAVTRDISRAYKSYRLDRFTKKYAVKGEYQWGKEYVTKKPLKAYEKQLLSRKDISFDTKQNILNRAKGLRQYGIPTEKGIQTQLFPKEFKAPALDKQLDLQIAKGSYVPKIEIIPKTKVIPTIRPSGIQAKLTDIYMPTKYPSPKTELHAIIFPYKTPSLIAKLIYKGFSAKYPIFQQAEYELLKPPQSIQDYESMWGIGKSKLELDKGIKSITKLAQLPKQDLRHMESLIAGFMPKQATRQLQRQRMKQVTSLSPASITLAISKSEQVVIPRTTGATRTKSQTIVIPDIIPPSPPIPIPKPPRIPKTYIPKDIIRPPLTFKFPKYPRQKSIFKLAKLPRQKLSYKPNIPALTFNVKSFKIPKNITGFEMYRPIPLFKKKRKKKR